MSFSGDAPAPARAAEGIARAVSVALLPHLQVRFKKSSSFIFIHSCFHICHLWILCIICRHSRKRDWPHLQSGSPLTKTLWATFSCLSTFKTGNSIQVQYEAGAGGSPLPSTFTPSLDNELVRSYANPLNTITIDKRWHWRRNCHYHGHLLSSQAWTISWWYQPFQLLLKIQDWLIWKSRCHYYTLAVWPLALSP